MGKINILDSSISNLIAAGEVVERPASVVKELVENSIDAGADVITVDIKNGGISYIRITDNGKGMEPDDVGIAFLRHATSKIRAAEDLNAIYTLGFRGEALSSVAAVAKIGITTKTADSPHATRVYIEGGEMEDVDEAGAPGGTTIEVKNLFFNTPARMKFLKKDTTEAGYIADVVEKFILAYPDISFRFINNGRQQLFSSGDSSLQNAIYTIYGKDYANALIPISYGDDVVSVSGFVGKSNISRPNRAYQSFFVNNRIIQNRTMTAALEQGYKNQLMGGKFPFAVLKLVVNPMFVDVNVHPNKKEVKFSDERKVFDTVHWAVKNALYEKPTYPEISLEKPKDNALNQAYKMPPVAQTVIKSEPQPRLRPEPKPQLHLQDVGFQEKDAASHEVLNIDYARATNGSNIMSEDANIDYQAGALETYNTAQITSSDLKNRFENYKIVGQIFDTYIVLECNGEMMLIDQHAAHERIGFERIMKQLSDGTAISQALLVPVSVGLSSSEFDLAMESIDFFDNIGFEIEEFGNNTIVIRMTPEDLPQEELKNLFIELLDDISKSKNDIISKAKERALFSIACKAAIKANHNMQPSEMDGLVKQVLELEGINTCPHGRPITIVLTKHELEKQFKRIV